MQNERRLQHGEVCGQQHHARVRIERQDHQAVAEICAVLYRENAGV